MISNDNLIGRNVCYLTIVMTFNISTHRVTGSPHRVTGSTHRATGSMNTSRLCF